MGVWSCLLEGEVLLQICYVTLESLQFEKKLTMDLGQYRYIGSEQNFNQNSGYEYNIRSPTNKKSLIPTPKSKSKGCETPNMRMNGRRKQNRKKKKKKKKKKKS